MVSSKETTDETAAKICHDIVQAFEQQLTYPGEIKVTVLRETRHVEMAPGTQDRAQATFDAI